jgi:hypothetical protein
LLPLLTFFSFATTGSTSIQNNFHTWTGSDQYLLKSWSWPVPYIVSKYESIDENNWNWNPSKGFYALAELLRGPSHTLNDRILFQNVTRENVIMAYQMEFYRAWIAGYNLIVGSEAFDNIIKDDDDGEEIIDRLVSLMPWNYNSEISIDQKYNTNQKERITVVVTYRVPKVKHLISIWRETKKKNESFQQWLTHTKNNLGAIDSLGLVERFLNKGLKVVLADISGISSAGYDISNIIACEVLDASCTKDKQLIGSSPPLIMNTKINFNGNIDVTEEQINLMDAVMRMYDCKYMNMMKKFEESDQLQLLYPTTLHDVFDSCGKNWTEDVERISMKKQLVCIAKGKSDCVL